MGVTMQNLVAVEPVKNPQNRLRINWDMGRRCNYICSYCFLHNRQPDDFPDTKDLHAVVDNMVDLDNNIALTMTGGEPTFHPGYMDIVEHLIKHKSAFSIINTQTNLGMPYKFFQEFARRFEGERKLRLSMSYHIEFAKVEDAIKN